MLVQKIKESIEKFNLDLSGKKVLTEAATGNYVVTSILSALSGAETYALVKESRYGSVEQVMKETTDLSGDLNVTDKIKFISAINEAPLEEIDVVTNTGFIRPIKGDFLSRLSGSCVIPLMWEPWEFRQDDLDLEKCIAKGIKVYGTDESDPRVRTLDYLAYSVAKLLLENECTPISTSVLLIGCNHFCDPVRKTLLNMRYHVKVVTDYNQPINDLDKYSVIISLENENERYLIGSNEDAYINESRLDSKHTVIHICGSISLSGEQRFLVDPENPAPFGYMSYTADYVDSRAVIDLHAAGLKVAEGMLEANKKGLRGREFKEFVIKNYPALSFDSPSYW